MTSPLVLIIEDDRDITSMVGHALKKFDCELEAIGEGNRALEFLHDNSPTLVILDLNLPFVGGDELIEYIRQAPHLTDTKVIVITVYKKEKVPFMVEHADFFFQKPYNLTDFRQAVGDILPTR